MTIGKQHKELKGRLGEEKLEQTTEFVYLGGLITEDEQCSRNINVELALHLCCLKKNNGIILPHGGNMESRKQTDMGGKVKQDLAEEDMDMSVALDTI